MKKVVYFGMYAPDYSRNRILINGLKKNKIAVIECNERRDFVRGLRYFFLLKKFFLDQCFHADFIFVGFPGQTDVPLAWLLARLFGKKLVFDAYYSLYNTIVFDRRDVKQTSFIAGYYWWLDKLSCTLADLVVVDTNQHINYFCQTFGLPKDKFLRIFIGAEDLIFFPRKNKNHRNLTVGFHGNYIPLQGVEYIIGAAKILKKVKRIKFTLIGNGITFQKCLVLSKKFKLDNIKFIPKTPYSQIPDYIAQMDICLGGPFGSSSKAMMVITNKTYEYMAMAKPTIVASTLATNELLIDKVNAFMCSPADESSLAEAISVLAADPRLRMRLAQNGYSLFKSSLTTKHLGRQLSVALESIL